ncbi:hypothetical protein ACWKSP_12180 [Micromonosporaceae bacterium Da 78-11]
MTTSTWTMVIGASAGLALALFGARMLVTGHAPARTARSFRSVRDAGCYHLLFGTALVLVVLGTGLAGNVLPLVTTVLALVLVGVAVFCFRPRSRRSARGK